MQIAFAYQIFILMCGKSSSARKPLTWRIKNSRRKKAYNCVICVWWTNYKIWINVTSTSQLCLISQFDSRESASIVVRLVLIFLICILFVFLVTGTLTEIRIAKQFRSLRTQVRSVFSKFRRRLLWLSSKWIHRLFTVIWIIKALWWCTRLFHGLGRAQQTTKVYK
jgi:hypothetical protein